VRPGAALLSLPLGTMLFDRRVRPPSLYGAVNKGFLSTGETGEFASENVGFGLNPGVELAPGETLFKTGEH